MDRLKGFNWLNYDGGKFSTSGQARHFSWTRRWTSRPPMSGAITPAASNRKAPTTISPGNISPASVNKDLADVLGNFVLRVTKFCAARFDGRMPGEGEYGDEEKALIAELDGRVKTYTGLSRGRRFPQGVRASCAPSGWRATSISPVRALDPYQAPTATRRRWARAWASTWCISSRT